MAPTDARREVEAPVLLGGVGVVGLARLGRPQPACVQGRATKREVVAPARQTFPQTGSLQMGRLAGWSPLLAASERPTTNEENSMPDASLHIDFHFDLMCPCSHRKLLHVVE